MAKQNVRARIAQINGLVEQTELNEAAFTRTHYVQIAKILNHFYEGENKEIIEAIAKQLSNQIFKPDNPNFNETMFMQAVTK